MHLFAAGFACCSFTVHAPGAVTSGQTATAQTVLTNASNGTVTNASVFLPQDASVGITCSSMSAAFDNVGITSDSSTGPGNYDGQGDSYSADGLASQGITPGSTVTVNGVKLTWPMSPLARPTTWRPKARYASGRGLLCLGAAAGRQDGPVRDPAGHKQQRGSGNDRNAHLRHRHRLTRPRRRVAAPVVLRVR
jgi:hypothetical protein